MIKVLTLLKEEFRDYQSLVDLIGSSCYAIVAPQEVGKGFVVYTVSEDPPLTKDGVGEYTIRVSVSQQDVDALIEVMDVAKQAMEAMSKAVYYQGSTEIEQGADQHYIINLNYTITI